ncbi:MAG: type II toxin-antitoxin system VapC family toxin [Micropepsaceae bacterium]
MVVDSSALLAILLGEPRHRTMTKALEQADEKRISAVNFVEASVVIETRKGAAGLIELDRLIELSGIEIAAIDERIAREARTAYRHFGKGRHPARLNLGDCFAYALAKVLDEPILCVGSDFAKTDIPIVP